jgi:two-component system nitrate/nitrite response regulator NarL
MTIHHYHLRTAASAPSARWREAFPAGETLDGLAVDRRLAGTGAAPCIVWVAAQDRQWPQQVQRIRGASAFARVVLLSAQPDEREAVRAFRAGVSGYAHSHAVPALLRDVGRTLEHGGLWLGESLMRRLLSATADVLAAQAAPGLSAREAEVAMAVAAGHSNKEVALVLGITERTVKAHLGTIFEKLGVRDRLQMAVRLNAAPTEQRPVAPPGLDLRPMALAAQRD